MGISVGYCVSWGSVVNFRAAEDIAWSLPIVAVLLKTAAIDYVVMLRSNDGAGV